MSIETVNHWGTQVVQSAWPVLWQSSLLILVLFTLDLLLRRRLRPAVRYSLWLVLLLKLVLPPSFALPTSVAWWMRSPSSPPAGPVLQELAISPAPDPVAVPVQIGPRPSSAPIVPRLSPAAWTLLGSAIVSLLLLASIFVRGRKAIALDRPATGASMQMEEMLVAAKEQAGMRSRIRLRLTDRPMSPAACGLLRPVILLPRLVVDQLPPIQLRAVLLHELFHLRRGDVWVNCLQSLLQVIFWWHPVLWIANARIRRLREEAVDDAVVVALDRQVEHYAAALVGVARLALQRPPVRLGFVGIVEPKKALRLRVERLLNTRPPRRAGLSLFSLVGITAFTAAALPMAKAPSRALEPAPDFEGGSAERPGARSVSYRASKEYTVTEPETRRSETLADAHPAVDAGAALETRIIRVDSNRLKKTLVEVTRLDQIQSQRDMQNAILVYLESREIALAPPKTVAWDERTSCLVVSASRAEVENIEEAVRPLSPNALDSAPETPSAESRDASRPALYTRVVKLGPGTLAQGLQRVLGLAAPPATDVEISQAARQFIESWGVDLRPPKSFYYHWSDGNIVIHANLEDLDHIETQVHRQLVSHERVEGDTAAPSTNKVEVQPTPTNAPPGVELPHVLPSMLEDDLLKLRSRIHSILPPIIPEIESGASESTNRSGLWPVRHVVWRARNVSTNLGSRVAWHINTAIEPLARVHNAAVDIGIVPSFLALPRPERSGATNSVAIPPRRVPLLGDLPILGRLFWLPPARNHGTPAKTPSASD